MSNFFRYENQTCPVCSNDFTENDDIVVCPICGTPHHRECYKKNGECGNFEKHNEGYRWTPAQSTEFEPMEKDSAPVQEPIFSAPFDSSQAPSTSFYTNQPNPYTLFPRTLEDDVATEEAADFIQLSSVKYIQNFFYLKSNKKTFNWAAFFFAPFWFFYRKLYKLGAIFLAITLLISAGINFLPPVQQLYTDMENWIMEYQNLDELTEEELLEASNEQAAFIKGNPVGSALIAVQGVLSLALQIYIGFNANKWYYNHTISSIRKIKKDTPDPAQQRLLLFKVGGMSMGAAFLSILANNIVVMAIEMLITFI